jgi:hypothetical protein
MRGNVKKKLKIFLNTELNPFRINKPEIVIDATYVINNKKYDISFIISE